MEIITFLYILGLVYLPSFADNTTVAVTSVSNDTTTVIPKVSEKNETTNETWKETQVIQSGEKVEDKKIQVRKGRNKNGGYWKSFLIPLGGNIKMGLHGDLTNVASGNLESKGSIGLSINGRDFSIGAKWGVGGNLGQGVNNAGSLGIGGTGEIRPPKWIKKKSTTTTQATETETTNNNVKQVVIRSSVTGVPVVNMGKNIKTKEDKGEWKNFNNYAKVFVQTPKS